MTQPMLRTSASRARHQTFGGPVVMSTSVMLTCVLTQTPDPQFEHEAFDRVIARMYETVRGGVASAQPGAQETPHSTPSEMIDDLRARSSRGELAPLAEAVKLLGWSARGWLPPHRRAVVEIVRSRASEALPLVLDEVAACSRAEVVDDAVSAISPLATHSEGVSALSRALKDRPEVDAKIAIIRTLGTARGDRAADARASLEAALEDTHGEVREAAAWALVNLGEPESRSALQAAVDRERHDAVRESLVEAYDALSDA